MKTKGGKTMNPTDAYRKELRKKELKRNKKERKKVREVGILKKDPEAIREQIKKLDSLTTDDGLVEKTRRHQKRKLEETLNLVLKKRKEYVDKAKESGEEPVMFSHLPAQRSKDEQQRPEASVATSHPLGMQAALNPMAGAGTPYANNVPIPPPPPMPKLSALSVPVPPPPPPPLSVPVPPPPPAPISVPVPPPPPPPPPPSQPPSEPPPPAVTGESSTSGANELPAHQSESDDSDQSDSDSQTDSDKDEDTDNEGAPPAMPQLPVQRAPAPPPQVLPQLPAMRPPFPPHGLVAMPMVPPPLVQVPPPHMFTVPYGVPLMPPRAQTEPPPQVVRGDKPFYVKSAAPTATKRPLAQHTPALTAMVPASVRVKRESAPKPLKPRPAVTPVRPPEPVSKPPSMDESYSAFLEDMKALGAFDV